MVFRTRYHCNLQLVSIWTIKFEDDGANGFGLA